MDRIDGMQSFVAVVESGSFTAAGQRLGISNKLVSKRVAQLENMVGLNLLHRTTKVYVVDPRGGAISGRSATGAG